MAPGIPLEGEGRKRFDGSGLYQCVIKLNDAPYLKSIVAPPERWCLRSSPFGPRRLVFRKLTALLMTSASRAIADRREHASEITKFTLFMPATGSVVCDVRIICNPWYADRPTRKR